MPYFIGAMFGLAAATVIANFIGIVMCFKASLLLGLASLVLEGTGLIEFTINLFGYNIAAEIARALQLAI